MGTASPPPGRGHPLATVASGPLAHRKQESGRATGRRGRLRSQTPNTGGKKTLSAGGLLCGNESPLCPDKETQEVRAPTINAEKC